MADKGNVMNRFAKRALRGLCVSAAIWLFMTAATAQTATSRLVSAANRFLATLSAQQRKSVLYAFDDDQQRARWSNLPTSFVPRGGISLKEMNSIQRSAAMALVSSALSPRGFEKVQQIMEGDEVLKVDEAKNGNRPPRGNGGPPLGNGGPPPGGGGPPPGARPNGPGGGAMFGKDLYYISILGTPSEKNPWMLQFGGHHLALNITIAGEHGVLTPTLTGAQPALYTSGGRTVRPLGQASDEALALLNALNDSERKQAILSYR